MIDFNDTTQTAEHSRESDCDELRVELLARLESVLATISTPMPGSSASSSRHSGSAPQCW